MLQAEIVSQLPLRHSGELSLLLSDIGQNRGMYPLRPSNLSTSLPSVWIVGHGIRKKHVQDTRLRARQVTICTQINLTLAVLPPKQGCWKAPPTPVCKAVSQRTLPLLFICWDTAEHKTAPGSQAACMPPPHNSVETRRVKPVLFSLWTAQWSIYSPADNSDHTRCIVD